METGDKKQIICSFIIDDLIQKDDPNEESVSPVPSPQLKTKYDQDRLNETSLKELADQEEQKKVMEEILEYKFKKNEDQKKTLEEILAYKFKKRNQ